MTEPTEEDVHPLRFVTLGPMRVERDGLALALGGRQQRAVLAVLLVNRPAVVSVARLADEIWGSQVPAGYVRTIQTYVHHLREALESGDAGNGNSTPNSHGRGRVIVTGGGGYQLVTGPEALDSLVFEELVGAARDLRKTGDLIAAQRHYEQALALWEGEPLADMADLPFASSYARRLEDVRLSAVEGLIDTRLSLGDHEAVLAQLRDMVTQYPLRERLHAQYMLALYRSGRQAEALESYRALRQILDDELGVEPSADLRQLHQAMLVQDPALDAPQPLATTPDGSTLEVASAAPGQAAIPQPAPSGRRRRSLVTALVAVLVVSGGAVAFSAWHQPSTSLAALPPNTLARIAPDGTLHDAIDLGMSPTAVAYGAGSLWVTGGTNGRLIRIDPKSRQKLGSVAVGQSPVALAVTAQDVWVANSRDGTVDRISTVTNSRVQTITVGALPAAIAAGPSGVWVANSGEDSVQRIDPKSGVAGPATDVGIRPDAIAVTPAAVWVANGDDSSVTAVDPHTGHDLHGPIRVGTSPAAITVADNAVWVADADSQSVDRIDARDGSPERRLPVGEGPVSIGTAAGHLLVGNIYDGTITIIDPVANRPLRHYSVGAPPRAMVAVGSSVWVVTGAFTGASHRGGTLVIAAQYLPGSYQSVDPGLDYQVLALGRTLRMVYDGLVAARYATATAGVSVVPDLATSIPLPADGGRTYTFTLRTGVRFSDGTVVKASDIRRSVQRSFMLQNYGPGPPEETGIVGGDRCGQTYESCPLSGVVADDATGTIVFHLVAANPYFLLQLAAFGQAVPPSAPAGLILTPVAGTGPYQISEFRRGDDDNHTVTKFTLTRNPYFKPWSYAAQPPGFPDVITYLKTPDEETAIRDVETGKADLYYLQGGRAAPFSRATMDQLYLDNPGQLQSDGDFAVHWLYLNRRVAPFNDIRVRRALNYAIDRNHLVDLYGGPKIARPTCQLLPPDLPGYRTYCPYSIGKPDEPYVGPNRALAKSLVAASHTRGMDVVVSGQNSRSSVAMGRYLVSVLRGLGYRSRQTVSSQGDLYNLPESVIFKLQIVESNSWFADYPAPYNFYSAVMDCAANPFGCNPATDAQAAAAHLADQTDPASAARLWAAVDRRVTDDAAILPLINQLEDFLTSRRVGNYQSTPGLGPLLSQMWVR